MCRSCGLLLRVPGCLLARWSGVLCHCAKFGGLYVLTDTDGLSNVRGREACCAFVLRL